MVDDIEVASRGDRAAWLVEAAGKLITSYGREEESHAEHGEWQLNVIDCAEPNKDAGPGVIELSGTNSILNRAQTVWAHPATSDFFAAHHLHSPIPIDASGVVLLRRAFVGVHRKNGDVVTVIPARSADPADGPLVRVSYPVVPALVAYAVPRDETQEAEVIFQFRCSPAQAQEALLLPTRLPNGYSQPLATEADVRSIVRRVGAASVAHHAVEDGGPVPLLRWALSGATLVDTQAAQEAFAYAQSSMTLAVLAQACELLPHLEPADRELYWAATLDMASDVLGHQDWAQMRADQAGPRELGEWLPQSLAQNCSDDFFALLALRTLPSPTSSARHLASVISHDEAALLRSSLGANARVMHWCRHVAS